MLFIKIPNIVFIVSLLALFLHSGVCNAGYEDEISHLLFYIEKSDCTFDRNGKKYSASEARGHMERKYNHLKKHIKTTEQFIQHVATKSSMSGQRYTVNCVTNTLNSSEWLSIELDKYRRQVDRNK